MPSKKIVKPKVALLKQKQKQKQSVVVNVNLARAKARAKSSAKKSGRKGSIMMLPPPIYASPIDRLTPAMYNSQGQQIKQQSMEEVLRNFLSNQQKQTAPVSTPNTLGSAPRATLKSVSSSDNSLRTKTPSTSIYSTIPSSSGSSSFSPDSLDEDASYRRNRQEYFNKYGKHLPPDLPSYYQNTYSDNVSELSDSSYFSKPMSTESQYDRALASPFSSDSSISTDSLMPTPFRNEEKTYLKASEPDYDINEPKSFSQNEARMSQGNIYESARRPERRPPVIIPNEEESSVESSVNVGGGEPKIFRPRKPRPLGDYEVVGEEEVISDNPFPEKMYNKMMGI